MISTTNSARFAAKSPYAIFSPFARSISTFLIFLACFTHSAISNPLPQPSLSCQISPGSTYTTQYHLDALQSDGTTISLQLQSLPGLDFATAEAFLESDRQTLTLIIQQPESAPLPANILIANLQVHNPDTGTTTYLQASTDSGGVMVIISEF